MFGALVFSALAGVAADAVERVLRASGRSTRQPWIMALIIAATWPLAAPFVLDAVPARGLANETSNVASVNQRAVGATQAVAVLSPGQSNHASAEGFESGMVSASGNIVRWMTRHDALLLAVWCLLSLSLFVRITLVMRHLSRARRLARRVQLDGEQLLVQDVLGPAVLGVIAPVIVIPSWLLFFDDSLRALVLRHEREHIAARDPLLIWLSVVVTTLLPWNLALWWMASRMRLAMEIDCDARTLQGSVDRTRYAKLLLVIAQRNRAIRFVPGLIHSRSHLHRRILAMRQGIPRFRAARMLIAGMLAVATSAAACSSGVRDTLAAPDRIAVSALRFAASVQVATEKQSPFRENDVDSVARMTSTRGNREQFVARIRGQRTARALVRFTVKADGSVDTSSFTVRRSSNPDFASAVRELVVAQRFHPARISGRPVAQRMHIEFEHENLRSAANGSTPSDSNETGCEADGSRSTWELWSMRDVPEDFADYVRIQFAPRRLPHVKYPLPPVCTRGHEPS